MAVIIVEDGSIVTNANSYVTEAELTTYASDRGVTLTGTSSVLILKAMDYLETLAYKGDIVEQEQPLLWPRYGVEINGYTFAYTDIPKQLKQAQMQLAISIDAGNDPMATVGRATKKEKVDVIEVEYMDNANDSALIVSVNRLLADLVVGSTGYGGQFKAIRA